MTKHEAYPGVGLLSDSTVFCSTSRKAELSHGHQRRLTQWTDSMVVFCALLCGISKYPCLLLHAFACFCCYPDPCDAGSRRSLRIRPSCTWCLRSISSAWCFWELPTPSMPFRLAGLSHSHVRVLGQAAYSSASSQALPRPAQWAPNARQV